MKAKAIRGYLEIIFSGAVLLAVVVIASVGSHMPARFRYYSVIYRKVTPCGSGPGTSQPRIDD